MQWELVILRAFHRQDHSGTVKHSVREPQWRWTSYFTGLQCGIMGESSQDVMLPTAQATIRVLQIHQPNPSNLKMKQQQQQIQFSPQKSWTMSHKKIRLPKNHRKWPAQEGVFEIRDFTNASTFERLSHQISLAARHWARALSAERSEPGKPEPLPRVEEVLQMKHGFELGGFRPGKYGETWWNPNRRCWKMDVSGIVRHWADDHVQELWCSKGEVLLSDLLSLTSTSGRTWFCFRFEGCFIFVSRWGLPGGHGRIARLDQSSHLPSVLRYDLVSRKLRGTCFSVLANPDDLRADLLLLIVVPDLGYVGWCRKAWVG